MTKNTNSYDSLTDMDRTHINALAGEEDFWDHLDELDHMSAGAREWDSPCQGGAL